MKIVCQPLLPVFRLIIFQRRDSCGAIRFIRWDAHKKTGYAWWLERFRSVLKFVDVVRLDHFRGFAGYYEIPYGARLPKRDSG